MHTPFNLVALSLLIGMASLGCSATREKPMHIEWTQGPSLPQGLGGHVAVLLDNRITVVGGTNWLNEKKFWRNEIWTLDEKSGTWNQTTKLPVGLALFAPAIQGNSLLLLGGWTEPGPMATTLRYRGGAVTPSPLTDLPSPRALAGGGSTGDAIYVIGGLADPVDFKTATASVLKCANAKSKWEEAAPLPKPLGLATVVSLDNKIYLFGGMGPIKGIATDASDAFSYDPNSNRWTTLAPLPSARRGSTSVAIDDRRILIIGGCHGDKETLVMLDEVLLFDTRTNTYTTCTPLPLAALCEQAVIKDNHIYIIGGEDKPRHRTDRVIIGTLSPEK